jgi:hypothetical protein
MKSKYGSYFMDDSLTSFGLLFFDVTSLGSFLFNRIVDNLVGNFFPNHNLTKVSSFIFEWMPLYFLT